MNTKRTMTKTNNVVIEGTINNCEFENNRWIKSVVIKNAQTIGRDAFFGCKSLEFVEMQMPAKDVRIICGAFQGCTSLKSIVIPEGVTEIGTGTFKNCTSLKSVVIPEGVTEIGYVAFENCQSLESIVLPESLKTIENCAFGHCTSLKSIVIPEGVTRIGDNAFNGCKSLAQVTAPIGVSMGISVFAHCKKLCDTNIPMACPQVGAFTGYKMLQTEDPIRSSVMAVLEIPADARRSSSGNRWCRCDKARVLKLIPMNEGDVRKGCTGVNLRHIRYVEGAMAYPDGFDTLRWNEITKGIHFLMTPKEALNSIR